MIFIAKPFSFLLIFSSWMVASPTLAFTLDRASGDIEFSVRPVLPSNPLNRVYDTSTSATSLQDALLAPGRGYPLISDPILPIQKKSGSIDVFTSLNDTWNDPRGSSSARTEVLVNPFLALAVVYFNPSNSSNPFLVDTIADNNSVRSSVFGSALFTSTSLGTGQEIIGFNGFGGFIDTTQTDAWVTGALTVKFGGAAPTNTFEILFGFDGFGRGREDFITGFSNGVEVNNVGRITNSISSNGNDIFFDDRFFVDGGFGSALFDIKDGDKISMEGTFTCVAFNASCLFADPKFFVSENVNLPDVPETDLEPITMLGAFLVIGFSTILKRKIKIS
jgi:hypothetical protein